VASIRAPSSATLPFTVTRPARIISSHFRREPWPWRASTFCSFSVGSGANGSSGGVPLRRGLSAAADGPGGSDFVIETGDWFCGGSWDLARLRRGVDQ
jgi:hypothetical protein